MKTTVLLLYTDWDEVLKMGFRFRYVKDYFSQRHIKNVLLWIVEIVAVLGIAAVCAFFFCQTAVMHEGSMEPTVSAGEKLLINKASYILGSPKRGDIILFRSSEDEKASLHIKRVIGLPKETVQIVDGQILIDGVTYIEQKDFPAIVDAGLAEKQITLGANEYFVLGDNRNNSEDSRHAEMGMVKKQNIIGKLWFVISPASEMGFLDK